MEIRSIRSRWLLGLFVTGGLVLFVAGIFMIGKQKNLFNPIFRLTTTFHNVSGLQVGNNVRFSGINVGTVDDIRIINDSTVLVEMIIQKGVQQFIKADCRAVLGSDGIIGDRVLVITKGSTAATIAREGMMLASGEPIEMDGIVSKLMVTVDNTEIVTQQLAEILIKINKGKGALGQLIQDSSIAENFKETIVNIKRSSKGLDENMNAAKNSFLLKGYFKKKEKQEEEKRALEKNGGKKPETKREARRREARERKEAEKQKAIDINSNK